MSDGPAAPLASLVEATAACTSAAFRLFALNIALARNFHQTASIPSFVAAGARTAPDQRGQDPVIDVERDGRIGIDLKFGSITFKEEPGGTYAIALVDVVVAAEDRAAEKMAPEKMAPDSGTRVQMDVRIAADPDKESILEVTERFRAHIVKTLRAAADTLDAATARTLLFYVPEP